VARTGYDAAVVGGGNLGLWTARGLARRGVGRVAVLDRGWFGFAATARSAGMVRAQGGTETAVLLGVRSRELYRLLGAEVGLDDGFTRTGYYVLAGSPEEAAHFRGLVDLRRRHGADAAWVERDEGRRRVPWFDWTNFPGATFDPDDGYVHPPIAARNVTVAVGRLPGIDLFERREVAGIERAPGGWRLRHAGGTREAERIVLAGGAAGGNLARLVGIDVPVCGSRHHVAVYERVGPRMPRPFPQLFAVAAGFYLRPEEQGLLVGLSRRELQEDGDRVALPIDRAFVDDRLPEVEALVPPLAGQPLTRLWAAAVDATPDSLPILDEALPGCFVASGGGHGMMWGPALGEATAELMANGNLSGLPAEEVGLARFAKPGGVHEPISLKAPLA
jgi:sarcosine oxidase, subunit beta